MLAAFRIWAMAVSGPYLDVLEVRKGGIEVLRTGSDYLILGNDLFPLQPEARAVKSLADAILSGAGYSACDPDAPWRAKDEDEDDDSDRAYDETRVIVVVANFTPGPVLRWLNLNRAQGWRKRHPRIALCLLAPDQTFDPSDFPMLGIDCFLLASRLGRWDNVEDRPSEFTVTLTGQVVALVVARLILENTLEYERDYRNSGVVPMYQLCRERPRFDALVSQLEARICGTKNPLVIREWDHARRAQVEVDHFLSE